MELLDSVRILGWRRVWRLWRGYRAGWLQTIGPYYTTRTMQTLLNVGFFDAMQQDGSVEVARFADTHGLDESILRSLVDSLYAGRILNRRGTGYVLDRRGRVLVDVARGWFDGVCGYEDLYHSLEALLRKEKVYGRDVTRRSDLVEKGRSEIESWIYFPLAAELLARTNRRRVLDLGCHNGAFLRHLCVSNPQMHGVGIDISPDAIESGRALTREGRLESRITLAVGDIRALDDVPTELAGVDAATVFFTLHELLYQGRDVLLELLRTFRATLPGVPLWVFEVDLATPEERRRRPGMSVQYVMQHELSHQKLVSRHAWRALFQEAGFATIEERKLGFARTVVFTVS